MPYQYAYITGCLILLLVWLFIFLKRKDLRREIIWASLVGLPFGFIEKFFVPFYWYPESLFDLMKQYGFGLEGFLYSFSVAGIAAVGYEFLEKRRAVKIKRNKKLHLGPFLLFILVYVGLEVFFPTKPMINLSLAFICGIISTALLRPDLLKQILASGLIFGVFYFIFFVFINTMFKDFIGQFYSPQLFGNFKILGVPLEEIFGAFTGGAFWSTIYEYTKSYREKRVS
ncbi:MAG: lycopene cyclase domain-containing protein [Candidatus Paceibacterota bacterium]|jgi:hypothetical protein